MPYSWKGVYGAGEIPQKGDIVRCVATAYTSVRYGDRRVVQGVDDGCIILVNVASPHGTSPYKASSFELVSRSAQLVEQGRHATARQQFQAVVTQGEPKVAQYLHVAYRIPGERSEWATTAALIRGGDLMVVSSTSGEKLKEEIKIRIENYPDEAWVILGGMAIASGKRRPAVDVTFRSL